jgi:hypothetical protein
MAYPSVTPSLRAFGSLVRKRRRSMYEVVTRVRNEGTTSTMSEITR